MKTNFNNLYTFKKLDVKIEVGSLQLLNRGQWTEKRLWVDET